MNAFTVEMCAELLEAFTLANRDDAVQVIVVTGAGTAFCAGTCVTRVLVPEPGRGDVVVMDNLSSHKAPAVRDAMESVGATLLPPAVRFGLQPDRTGLLKAEGSPAQSHRAHHPWPLERHRPHPRPLLAPGMRQLLRSPAATMQTDRKPP